jgi:hypothetical protein
MTMQGTENAVPTASKRLPWNKGKLTGAKPPLRPKHVWSIRTKLQVEGRTRDLAMFNLAIDSKLRGCDVIALKVEDVAPNGYSVDRATVRQKKTGQPVRFELTEQTRQAVDDYIRVAGKKPGEALFVGRRGQGRCMSTRQYARLVSEWIGSIGLDPNLFGTHAAPGGTASFSFARCSALKCKLTAPRASVIWSRRRAPTSATMSFPYASTHAMATAMRRREYPVRAAYTLHCRLLSLPSIKSQGRTLR